MTMRARRYRERDPYERMSDAPMSTNGKEIWRVPFVEVDISFFDDDVGVSTTDTLNAGQGKHNLFFAVDVGV